MKIIHSADIQVKNREKNLYRPTFNTLKQIEKHIKQQEAEVVILAGDFFEYATPTDSERKLIYNFLSRLLNIKTLKELVIFAGNHDLLKEKKETETSIGNNPINVYMELLLNLDQSLYDKVIYANQSKIYPSNISDKIEYIAFSLEDDMAFEGHEYINPNKLQICLFHAMIKEYVDSVKLPLRKDVYQDLKSIEIFPKRSLIPSGDIHSNLRFEGLEDQIFIYPGSPIQQTHNEGWFIKISDVNEIQKSAENKVLKVYEFSDTLEKVELKNIVFTELPLIHSVNYLTIELNNKVSHEIIADKLKEFFNTFNKFDITNWGTCFIKFKSSNVFLKYELRFTEIIQTYFDNIKQKYPDIRFEYDKLIQTANTINNAVIQEILSEKEKELTENAEQNQQELGLTDIGKLDIDSLILSDVHLHKLFGSVLDDTLKSVEDSDVTNQELANDIRALFQKELGELNNKSKRYNIQFESIETNGFMALTNNRIELNIPGITRIIGTNGIGKTTLYNMLRWVTTGEVFTEMSKASAMKNNLIVFNKKKFDSDMVFVKLFMFVNDLPVTAIRTIERKWKNNTTDEQKISLKWKNYVSTVDRQFKLEISTPTGEIKTFVGDQAERSILLWFGDTLNNILFMNQVKLEKLLLSASAKLNEMVLNFVGVDYIEKLENNLDNVKTELTTVSKPVKSKEQLIMDITDAKIQIELTENEVSRLSLLQTETEKELKLVDEQKTIANSELVTIGDIPKEITTYKTEIDVLTEFLKDFQKKEKFPKIPFELVSPILDENQISNILKLNKEYEDGIIDAQKIIDDKTLLNKDLIERELDDLVQAETCNIHEDKLVQETKIQQQQDVVKGQFKNILEYLNTTITGLKEKKQKCSDELLTAEITLKTTRETIANNKTTIDSGICEKCKRPFDANFDEHKKQLEDDNILLSSTVENLTTTILEKKTFLGKVMTYITQYEGYRDLAVKNDILILQVSVLLKPCESYFHQIISSNEYIVENQKELERLQTLHNNWLLTDKIQYNNFDVMNYIKNDILDEIVMKIKANSKLSAQNLINIGTYKDSIIFNNDQISHIKELHTIALQNYTNLFNENVKKNNAIEIENQEIDVYNNSQLIKSSELSKLETTIQNLTLVQLPIYNTQKEKLAKIQIEIDTKTTELSDIKDSITTNKIAFETNKTKKKLSEDLYNQYLKYQKNNLIWKIYSKLIKSSFKEIIFEYYRTFLNNTLNTLLIDLPFKLYWNEDSELYHQDVKEGILTYQPVQQSSGMETCFLALALVYTIHLLNVKNTVSHIFIDEISGTLNDGEDLSYEATNYKEMLVLVLNKFKDKSIFIIDHSIENLFQTLTYEVKSIGIGSVYTKV